MKQKFADLSAIALYLGEKWGLPVCSNRHWTVNPNCFRIMAPNNVPIFECFFTPESDGLWSITSLQYIDDPDHDPAMWKLI